MRIGALSLIAALSLASISTQAQEKPADSIADNPEIRKSVVKIFTTSREPDLARPYKKQDPEESSGSGVVIDGKRILTNNHVVRYAQRILVQPEGSSDKLKARVVATGAGIDLAVIELEDASFFDSHPPITFADQLPEVGQGVVSYGYPLGGDALSITKGIVSRIEYAPYDSDTMGLRIQVDAALNHGNSGGPVVSGDKLVGIVFSGIDTAQNIGYLIPVDEVKAFLEDIADGRYDSRPQLYLSLQTLENDALRSFLKMPKGWNGIVVSQSFDESSGNPLRKWDVIDTIGEHDIDDAGMVTVKPNLRLSFEYFVPKLAAGGMIELGIIRAGEKMTVRVPVASTRHRVIRGLNGGYPSFFLIGPLQFTPVYEEHRGIDARLLAMRGSPILNRGLDEPAFEGEELVAGPFRMFAHATSKGYDAGFFPILKSVNGVAIKNLRHLVETLRDLKDEYVTFEWHDDAVESLVFRREELINSTEEILDDNSIRSQMSDDLKDVWNTTGH
ncbi:MAG: trypsin-like peptidase domain-containing protein [Phycisphaerales bacterium]